MGLGGMCKLARHNNCCGKTWQEWLSDLQHRTSGKVKEPWHQIGSAQCGLATITDPGPQVHDDEAPGVADAGALDGRLKQRQGGLGTDLCVLGSPMRAIPHVSGLWQGVGCHVLHRPHVLRCHLWHLQWTSFNANVALILCNGGTNRQEILWGNLKTTECWHMGFKTHEILQSIQCMANMARCARDKVRNGGTCRPMVGC